MLLKIYITYDVDDDAGHKIAQVSVNTSVVKKYEERDSLKILRSDARVSFAVGFWNLVSDGKKNILAEYRHCLLYTSV